MYEKKPLEIVGKVPGKKLDFYEIVQLGTFEEISKKMVGDVFRSLESERNTKKLIKKIVGNVGFTLNEEILDEAVMFIDMRHLIVHNSRKADWAFANKY